MNLTKIGLFVLACLIFSSNTVLAQNTKDNKDSKTTKTNKDSKSTTSKDSKTKNSKDSKDSKSSKDSKTADNKTTDSKTASNTKDNKVKPAKNGNSSAAIAVQVHGLNRDEKNAMSRCPVHNRHMSLNDSYEAEDNNLPHGDHYPFAYQLCYRRYCESCTKVMLKEAKDALAADKAIKSQDSEHCKVHGSKLKPNSDRSKSEYEKNPSSDMPHAKQYLLKYYCPVCTKIHKIQNKAG